MKLQNIPLDQLHVSKLNMRHSRKAPDIADIYPSIRDDGVFQTLLVRKEAKGFGIIAGRRRYFALRKAAKETGKSLTAPCGIMEAGDNASAIEASLLENMARLPAGEFEQYDAFARLAAGKKTPEDIAETFGITPLKVRRILALANLKPEIKALYEANRIAVPTLRAMTLASHEQQDMWLTLFDSDDDHAPQGEQLKAWLTGGARIRLETALFDLDTYKGTLLTDLFSETGYFADPDLFWTHQNAAIAERMDTYKADGWSDVVVMDRGEQFCTWEYGTRGKDAGGKVFISTRHDGSVTVHEGYLSLTDIKKIDAILKTDPKAASKAATKPEISGPLGDYISLHRHAAISASLLDHPHIALRLTVAHMLAGSDLWEVKPEKTEARKEATSQSVAASIGAARIDAERTALFDLLGIRPSQPDYSPQRKIANCDAASVFAALLKQDNATVMKVMTLGMALSLKAGSVQIEAIPLVVPVDMDAFWSPDDAFFDLLRDKRVINTMVAEIAGPATAKAHLTDTGKAQKEIIRNRIAGHGTDTNQDWRPRWMRTKPSSYLDGTACKIETVSKRASVLVNPKPKRRKKVA